MNRKIFTTITAIAVVSFLVGGEVAQKILFKRIDEERIREDILDQFIDICHRAGADEVYYD